MVLSTAWKEIHAYVYSLNGIHLIWRSWHDLPKRQIKAITKYTMYTLDVEYMHCANVWQCKILTNGVISDFGEETFDEGCFLPVKHAIIIITACACDRYQHSLWCSTPSDNLENVQRVWLIIIWCAGLFIGLKYLNKDINFPGFVTTIIEYVLHVSHKYWNQRYLNSFIQLQNIDKE